MSKTKRSVIVQKKKKKKKRPKSSSSSCTSSVHVSDPFALIVPHEAIAREVLKTMLSTDSKNGTSHTTYHTCIPGCFSKLLVCPFSIDTVLCVLCSRSVRAGCPAWSCSSPTSLRLVEAEAKGTADAEEDADVERAEEAAGAASGVQPDRRYCIVRVWDKYLSTFSHVCYFFDVC